VLIKTKLKRKADFMNENTLNAVEEVVSGDVEKVKKTKANKTVLWEEHFENFDVEDEWADVRGNDYTKERLVEFMLAGKPEPKTVEKYGLVYALNPMDNSKTLTFTNRKTLGYKITESKMSILSYLKKAYEDMEQGIIPVEDSSLLPIHVNDRREAGLMTKFLHHLGF
jgi:hypothetical protein